MQFEQEVLHRLDEILVVLRSGPPSRPADKRARDARTRIQVRAESFVRGALLAGPRPWADIVEHGRRFGHTEATMRRQRDRVAEQVMQEGKTLWKLKEDSSGTRR